MEGGEEKILRKIYSIPGFGGPMWRREGGGRVGMVHWAGRDFSGALFFIFAFSAVFNSLLFLQTFENFYHIETLNIVNDPYMEY